MVKYSVVFEVRTEFLSNTYANSIKVFRGFPRSLEKMLSWYTNSKLHCMSPMQPSNINIKFRPQ
jgi:hypothetical protein